MPIMIKIIHRISHLLSSTDPIISHLCPPNKCSFSVFQKYAIHPATRFTHKGALTAFAGVDPGKNESGSYAQKSVHTSKRGSAPLRKTLFLVMDSLIKTMPQGDPVYEFMNKKRSQGKPYYVYMTAGANKFLRIYYGRVKEYLSEHPETAVN